MQKSKNAQKETIDRTMNLLLNSLELGSKTLFSTNYTTSGKKTILVDLHAQALTELTVLTDIDLKICKLLQRRKIVKKGIKKRLFSGVREFINQPLLKMTSLFIQVLKKQVQKQVSTGITYPLSFTGQEPKLEDTGGTSEIIGNIYENPNLLN
jgi:hypothetical protein